MTDEKLQKRSEEVQKHSHHLAKRLEKKFLKDWEKEIEKTPNTLDRELISLMAIRIFIDMVTIGYLTVVPKILRQSAVESIHKHADLALKYMEEQENEK